MVANTLPVDLPLPRTLGVGSKGQIFLNMAILRIKLKGIKNVANIFPTDPPPPPNPWDEVKRVKIQLFQNAVMHIKLNGITNAATW